MQSKVILLPDVPVSAQTRMSNWYAAGNNRRNGKSGGKMSKRSQSLVVEAMQIVGDPVQRTETKRKHAPFKQEVIMRWRKMSLRKERNLNS